MSKFSLKDQVSHLDPLPALDTFSKIDCKIYSFKKKKQSSCSLFSKKNNSKSNNLRVNKGGGSFKWATNSHWWLAHFWGHFAFLWVFLAYFSASLWMFFSHSSFFSLFFFSSSFSLMNAVVSSLVRSMLGGLLLLTLFFSGGFLTRIGTKSVKEIFLFALFAGEKDTFQKSEPIFEPPPCSFLTSCCILQMACTKTSARKTSGKLDALGQPRASTQSHKAMRLNQWDEKQMEKAVKVVRAQQVPGYQGDKFSLRQVTEMYSVPYEMLHKWANFMIEGTGHHSGGDQHPKVLTEG